MIYVARKGMMVYLIGFPDQAKKQILCVLRAFVVRFFFFYRKDVGLGDVRAERA